MNKSYVYFVSNSLHIKIGKANDIQKRMQMLQTGSSIPLILLGFIECDSPKSALCIENMLHDEYKMFRTCGEWFRLSIYQIMGIIDDFGGEVMDQTNWINYLEKHYQDLHTYVENYQKGQTDEGCLL